MAMMQRSQRKAIEVVLSLMPLYAQSEREVALTQSKCSASPRFSHRLTIQFLPQSNQVRMTLLRQAPYTQDILIAADLAPRR